MNREELYDIVNEYVCEAKVNMLSEMGSFNTYFNGYDVDYLKEEVDMEDGKGMKLMPVFIVLLYCDTSFDHFVEKFVKNQKYWHASIGFGPGLSKCYSFNYDECNANKFKGGLSFESIKFYKEEHPTGTMEVNCIFLGKEKYDQLRATLDYYIENKEKTKYSFINLAYSFFGKKTANGTKFNLVCSTFVDTILKSVNININNKQTNLVKPDDLSKTKENKKQYKVYEGSIAKYDADKVAEKVEKLGNDLNNEYFSDKKNQ